MFAGSLSLEGFDGSQPNFHTGVDCLKPCWKPFLTIWQPSWKNTVSCPRRFNTGKFQLVMPLFNIPILFAHIENCKTLNDPQTPLADPPESNHKTCSVLSYEKYHTGFGGVKNHICIFRGGSCQKIPLSHTKHRPIWLFSLCVKWIPVWRPYKLGTHSHTHTLSVHGDLSKNANGHGHFCLSVQNLI